MDESRLKHSVSSSALKDAPARPALTAEQVYQDYAPRVFNVARRMLSNEYDAEDVTQDVLLQVVRKLPTFRGESAFPTWLHRVTVNAALMHRRKHAAAPSPLPPLPPGERGRGEGGGEWLEGGQRPRSGRSREQPPEQELIDREARQAIDTAIAGLPDGYREVLVMADVEELSNAEVAEALSLSLPAVKSRLHRARLMLRDALASHFDEVSVN